MVPCHSLAPPQLSAPTSRLPRLHVALPCALSTPLQQACLPTSCSSKARIERNTLLYHLGSHQEGKAVAVKASHLNRHTRVVSAAASAAAAGIPSAASSAAPFQADLVLELEGAGQKIHVFGVEHSDPQPHIAEFIYRLRPRAVVVETAVTPEHGSRPGNTISCRDRVIEGPQAFFMRVFCGIAAQLQELEEKGKDPLSSGLWKQVSQGQFRGEQLAYIAGLACNTKIVFGDRPKDITYRRLYGLSSLAQLDEGFGYQAISNYEYILELVQGSAPGGTSSTSNSSSSSDGSSSSGSTQAFVESSNRNSSASVSSSAEGDDAAPNEIHPSEATHWVDRIMMKEREALMCKVAFDAALGQLPALDPKLPPPEASPTEAASSHPGSSNDKGRSQDVVLVVGSAHLPGIVSMWSNGLWKDLLGNNGQSLLGSPLLTCPPLSSVPEKQVHEDPQVGLKRGLLHCLMRLSVTGEVLDDLETTLGPLPPSQQLSYDAISEIYTSDRAMLACLPQDLLNKVWQGSQPGSSVHEMDPWAALQLFRDNRPINGGTGCTEEMVAVVRGLNFELD